jgi:fibronectin-binding autotransporter adhesin
VVNGGGLFLRGSDLTICQTPSRATLQGNRLLGNRADKGGAMVIDLGYQAQSTNDIVANNVTNGFQTAAVHVGVGQLEIRHGTLVGNGRYAISTGSGTAALTNTIVASHSVAGLAGNITSQTSLFFGNASTCSNGAACVNNRTGDPRFLWPLANDYHLCQNSAAIDQGVSTGVNSDFEGDARPQGSGVDIGADEWNEVSCKRIRTVFLPIVIRSGLV